MNKLVALKLMKRPRKCYELWMVNDKGHFKMAGMGYFDGKGLIRERKNNPHIHHVLHKGRFKMYFRFVVAKMFGY